MTLSMAGLTIPRELTAARLAPPRLRSSSRLAAFCGIGNASRLKISTRFAIHVLDLFF
jgi:hypothetical protein